MASLSSVVCFLIGACTLTTALPASPFQQVNRENELKGQGPTIRRCPTDIMIVIDNSGSVVGVFDDEKEIAASLVEAMDVGPRATRVAYMQFSSRARLVFPFEQFAEKAAITKAIRELHKVGTLTRTVNAFKLANEDFVSNSRQGANKIILIVTDGHSQNTPKELTEAISALNDTGVAIFVSTASPSPDLFEMDIYTQNRRERIFLSNNVTQMPAFISGFIASGACLEETEPVEEEFVIQPPPIEIDLCGAVTDLTVVVDNSGSVKKVFDQEKEIAATLISALNVGTGTRVAMVQYSDHPNKYFGYDEHASRFEISKALRGLEPVGGSTNTLDGLKMAYEEIKANRRPDAKQFMLLITDGHSQNMFPDLIDITAKLNDLGVAIWLATASDDVDFQEFFLYTQRRYDHVFMKNNITDLVPVVTRTIECRLVDKDGRPIANLEEANKMIDAGDKKSQHA